MSKLLQFVSLQLSKGSNFLPKRQPNPLKTFIRHESIRGPPKQLNPRTEAALRAADRVPQNFELIYRSRLTNWVNWCYPLSILSYVLVACGYYYFKFCMQNVSYPVMDEGPKALSPIAYNSSNEVNITFGFYLAMNTLTLYLLRRTPTRIWMDSAKGEYRMILLGNLPPFKRQIVFEAGEVTRKHLMPENSLQEVMHRYRRRFYNITSVDFRSPGEYYTMVGHNWRREDELD